MVGAPLGISQKSDESVPDLLRRFLSDLVAVDFFFDL